MKAAPGVTLVLAVAAFAALPAAALEKCVSPSGRITYSEQPCPPASKSSTVRGSAPAASAGAGSKSAAAGAKSSAAKQGGAGAHKRAGLAMGGSRAGGPVEVRYADVRGATREALLAELKVLGMHGRAEWSLAYEYQPRRAGKACGVASLQTTLKQAMTLPRWSPPPGTSPKLVSDWMRYVSGLRKHSEGHLAIGRDMQEAFRDALAVTQARCEQLAATIKSHFDLLHERHRAREKAYDFETASGRTEGAEFVEY